MTPEEITKLAREYAESTAPYNKLADYPEAKPLIEVMKSVYARFVDEQVDSYIGFVEWLLEKHYIISKDSLQREYQESISEAVGTTKIVN